MLFFMRLILTPISALMKTGCKEVENFFSAHLFHSYLSKSKQELAPS